MKTQALRPLPHTPLCRAKVEGQIKGKEMKILGKTLTVPFPAIKVCSFQDE